jgi:hypothetical protein
MSAGIKRINTGKGHWYRIDGRKADGVTTLLSDGLPKPALLPWGIRSVAEYAADHLDRLVEMQPMGREAIVAALKQAPYSDRDRAAKRGTEVHGLAEKLINGVEVDVPDELAGHVESYVRYLDEWKPTPVLVEATVASRKWGYCGTLDAVYDLPDGRRVIGDIKTSRSGIFPEIVLQLAAYRYAEVYLDGDDEKPMADVGITHAQGIWVRADGYDVYDLPADEAAFNKFLHVATVARWAKSSRGLVGESVRPTTGEAA